MVWPQVSKHQFNLKDKHVRKLVCPYIDKEYKNVNQKKINETHNTKF